MPRNLPWLAGASRRQEPKETPTTARTTTQRTSQSSPEDLVDEDLNPTRPDTPKPRKLKRNTRTPSTSPPPAPPDIVYMREGYNEDDIYIMVEDEFLSTAKMFTQHLHHAEYVRFKRLAKSRGAGVLDAIQRPVDGKTAQSAALKMKIEGRETAKSIKDAMKGEANGSSDEDGYMYDPQLAGLMTGAKASRKDLSGMAKAMSNTRAAAGFSQSPRNVERKKDAFASVEPSSAVPATSRSRVAFEEEDLSGSEDDLDAVPPSTSSNLLRPTKTAYTLNGQTAPHKKSPGGRDELPNFAGSSAGLTLTRPGDRGHHIKPEIKAEEPMSPSALRSDRGSDDRIRVSPGYASKRKAERERRQRQEKRKASTAIEVPTFVI